MTVLVLSCMTAGCAQPLLRSANTETAQQTTYADAMDSSPVQTDTPVTTDLPETTVPETLPPETTAPAPLQTMEVTGGGNIDLSPKGDNHDGSTGTYAPSALMYHAEALRGGLYIFVCRRICSDGKEKHYSYV